MKHETFADFETLRGSFDASSRPVLTVDTDKYQALLDEAGFTEQEREAYLQSLWTLVVTFVELGFGVHPLQEVCGQDETSDIEALATAFDQVDSKEAEHKPET